MTSNKINRVSLSMEILTKPNFTTSCAILQQFSLLLDKYVGIYATLNLPNDKPLHIYMYTYYTQMYELAICKHPILE